MYSKTLNWLLKFKIFLNYAIDSLFFYGFGMYLLRNCLFDLIRRNVG